MRHCSRCKTRFVRLAPQRNAFERLLGLLMIYPTRCQICGHRYLSFTVRHVHIPQRDFQRVPVQYPARVLGTSPFDELAGQEGRVVNLSIGGCLFEGMFRAHEGHRLRLQIEVDDEHAPIMIDEAVVSSRPGHGVGLRFTKLRRMEKRRIGRLVRGRLTGVWVKGAHLC